MYAAVSRMGVSCVALSSFAICSTAGSGIVIVIGTTVNGVAVNGIIISDVTVSSVASSQ